MVPESAGVGFVAQ